MKSPLIGVSLHYELKSPKLRRPTQCAYEYNHTRWKEAVYKHGGLPVYLPSVGTDEEMAGILNRLDGIIIVGGSDIEPSFYGAKRSPKCERSAPERDEYEIRLAKIALEAKMPVLGICRGMQIINIMMGGTLFQDLSDIGREVLEHRNSPKKDYKRFHAVNVERDSRLHSIFGKTRIDVNTSHHQAVAKAGDRLDVSSRADDEIVEGIEYTGDSYMIGVQWHPEAMADSESTDRLFADFLFNCSNS